MKTVYKYPLEITDEQTILLPSSAKPLHVATQCGDLHLWALVDTDAPIVPRKFRIHGTGHQIHDADRLSFIGTLMMHDRQLVFHVFEVVA